MCGDGIVEGDEECDDGNDIAGDSCDPNCTVPRCGNGVATSWEDCDDGNNVSGDGCDEDCTVTGCGNGIVTSGEECDDGGEADADGCDADCHLEAGWECTGEPSDCAIDETCNHGGATDGVCDGDDECVPATGLCTPMLDTDNDGDGYTENEGDCNDEVFEVNPGVAEVCGDNIDNQCDGHDEYCDAPAGTVAVGSYYIAKYEASRQDATFDSAGTDDAGAPRFVVAVLPWTDISWAGAADACFRAGMRLCTAEEWQTACDGTPGAGGRTYCYDGAYASTTCNSEMSAPFTTGAFALCTTPEGVLDLVGNVSEWAGETLVDAANFGGDWSSGSLGTCSSDGGQDPGSPDAGVGFRCCISADDDLDADGWNNASDCDDSDPDVNPGEVEICGNAVDEDCSGDANDLDCDGYDDVAIGGTDCDDNDPDLNPDAVETCNGIDDNCDGNVDEGFDADGDGWPSCYDCNDGLTPVHPCTADTPGDALDQDCNGDPDTTGPPEYCGTCPDCPGCNMVWAANAYVCIDRYEASHGPGGAARSVADADPWVEVDWYEASAACAAAGKRLCTQDEWFAACSGPPPFTVFPYGDVFDPHACNGADNGVNEVLPTGSMPDCEGGYPGLFDFSGNVWEWTSSCDTSSCWVRGGSILNDESKMQCTAGYVRFQGFTRDYIGFRCCR